MAGYLAATRVQEQLSRIPHSGPAPHTAAGRPGRSQPPQLHAPAATRDAHIRRERPSTSLVQRPATAATGDGANASTGARPGSASADGRLPSASKRLLAARRRPRRSDAILHVQQLPPYAQKAIPNDDQVARAEYYKHAPGFQVRRDTFDYRGTYFAWNGMTYIPGTLSCGEPFWSLGVRYAWSEGYGYNNNCSQLPQRPYIFGGTLHVWNGEGFVLCESAVVAR